MMNAAKVTGSGMALPKKIVTNHDLARLMTTSDEWIRQRTGIEERRWMSEGESPSQLAYDASVAALNSAGLKAQDLDYILVATLSPERYFPGTVSYLQQKLGLQTTPGLDIRAQCSGFVYGLDMAQALVKSGLYKKVLLVGVEVQSVALEKNDRGRDMAVLFGDGAGAVVIEATQDKGSGIIAVKTHLEGLNAERLGVHSPAASDLNWMTSTDIAEGKIHPKMDGKYVFKNAVSRMPEVIQEVLAHVGKKPSDIDFWLFHQANLRINEHIAESMGIPKEKTYNNIQKYGNMSAASIPVAFHEARVAGLIKPGDLVMMTAFGAGFTWGSALVKI